MTEEQRARWLELGNERCIKGSILVGSESYLSICATITAEAVAAERARLGLDTPLIEDWHAGVKREAAYQIAR